MPEETPASSNSSQSSAKSSADPSSEAASSTQASEKSPQPPYPKRQSFFEKGVQGKIIATIKVQGSRLLRDTGEGLLIGSQWLQEQTSETDEAKADAVEKSVLQQFGALWKQWSKLLEQIRSSLPRKWRARLSDTRFTGILVGIVVCLWVAASSGSSGRSSGVETARTIDQTPPSRARRQLKPVESTVKSRPYEGPAKSPKTAPPLGNRDVEQTESTLDSSALDISAEAEVSLIDMAEAEFALALDPSNPAISDSETSDSETSVPNLTIEASSQPINPIDDSGAEEVEAIAEQSSSPEHTSEFISENHSAELIPAADSPRVVSETDSALEPDLVQDSAPATDPATENFSGDDNLEPAPKQAPEQNLDQAKLPSDPFNLDESPDETAPIDKPSGSDRLELEDSSIEEDATKSARIEDKAITEIRSQLNAATHLPELIDTLEIRSFQTELVLKLTSTWFELPYDEQDNQAQTLYSTAQSLNFNTLKILDKDNNRIVRKPVIGEGVIILKRRA